MQGLNKIVFVFLYAICLSFTTSAYADFINGFFTSPLSTGWTAKGYLFTGYATNVNLPPKSLNDIKLASSTNLPNGISDIITGPTQTLYDYFLQGSNPPTTLKLPESSNNSAMINLRSVNLPRAVSGNSAKPAGWSTYAKQATALSQTITVGPSDFTGGVVHIRFKVAAVMENPDHKPAEQPFYAVQINNLTTGRTGSNPLYFQWSYAAQPGVPWKIIPSKGTNSGSNGTYNYIDWQSYDFAPGNSLISEGDEIQLIVLAAGCSLGGHDGHVYLDNVTTQSPTSGLSIVAEGPATVLAGQTITYNYTFKNNGTSVGDDLTGVVITAYMPQTQGTSTPYDTVFNFVSPTTTGVAGTCLFSALTNIVTCNIPSLPHGETGTFSMTVGVPQEWESSYGPINNGNFPISANGYNPVLGNLVQTNIITAPPSPTFSHLVVDVSGLEINGRNPQLTNGDAYSGTYTCSNVAPGNITAASASCDINDLPNGLSVTGCTIDNLGPWSAPYDIPLGSRVTCTVAGTVTSSISTSFDAIVRSDAVSNNNVDTNYATMVYDIYNNPVPIPATLNGSPILSPAQICCGRPVLLYDLTIPGDEPANYEIISITGNIQCALENNGSSQYVKIFGKPGTCTIQGSKTNQISSPLVLVAN
jgi:hypothetical protein